MSETLESKHYTVTEQISVFIVDRLTRMPFDQTRPGGSSNAYIPAAQAPSDSHLWLNVYYST